MNIQVIKKMAAQGEVELVITVPFQEQQSVLQKSARSLTEKKPLKGFRPGKAPFEMVEKMYGGQAILASALEELVAASFRKAVTQEKLVTIGQPQIDLLKEAFGNDLEYKAVVSLLPEVQVGEYDKVKVKKQDVKVDEKKVQGVIKNLQNMRATEAKVDRTAQKRDLVAIDFATTVDKVAIEGGDAKNYKLVLGDNHMIPGFEDEVMGAKAGEEKKFKLKFPKDYKKDLAGKEAEFTVKVHDVFERKLPELNDEFAKNLGQDTMKALEDAIRDNVKQEAKEKEMQRQELEMLQGLVKESTFGPIPKMLLDNELHRMSHELQDEVERQGAKFEEYLQSIGKTREDLQKDFAPKADERVKTALVTRQISEREKIAATDEEVDREIEAVKEQYQGQPQILKNIERAEYREYLYNTISNRKVIEWLKKKIIS